MNALLRNDAQAGVFKFGVDLAGKIAVRRIGLDDRQGAFDGHLVTP